MTRHSRYMTLDNGIFYYLMGISAQQHRVCTGLFHRTRYVCTKRHVMVDCDIRSTNLSRHVFGVCFGIVYFYILTFIMFMSIDCNNCIINGTSHPTIHALPNFMSSMNLYFVFTCMYVYEDGWGIKTLCNGLITKFLSRPSRAKIPLAMTPKYFLKLVFTIAKKYVDIMLNGILLFLFILNMILIVICNCSILNPGPNSLSVVYNNIHGFINTRDLASETPPLNMTKVHEIHGYIFTHKPDIVILNETWLKRSILSNEVLPDNYKVFRVDRSLKSHPIDPIRPKKFRKNGGGVLIAHRCDIDISSVKFTKVSVQAELLSVSLKTQCGKKFCIGINILSCRNSRNG